MHMQVDNTEFNNSNSIQSVLIFNQVELKSKKRSTKIRKSESELISRLLHTHTQKTVDPKNQKVKPEQEKSDV